MENNYSVYQNFEEKFFIKNDSVRAADEISLWKTEAAETDV